MLHQRIASNLRDHLSNVRDYSPNAGPSSVTSLQTSAAPNSGEESPFQTGSNPLIFFPAPSSNPRPEHAIARLDTSSLRYDLLAAAAHRCSSFFAEAAVLVLVLGILDRFLASNRIELHWISGAFLIALSLLAISIATDVSARRWLRAH